uniref:Aldose 1-epimerase n=1 Tax=Ciona savignyi TaxID=51511 RepID=H2ZBA5_CIOSA
MYELKSQHIGVGLINIGASISYLKVPDKNGKLDDIVTGFPDAQGFIDCDRYFGCVVGRVANRVAGGKFILSGKQWVLPINNGPNCNHGGPHGFDKVVARSSCNVAKTSFCNLRCLFFSVTSPHEDMGFPGELVSTVTYSLNGDTLEVQYNASSDQPTPVNLTNHANFNLGGHVSYDHKLSVSADHYLPTDEFCLVTGELAAVKGTDFDLHEPVLLTQDLLSNLPGGGYDHNFCLTREKTRHRAAVLTHQTNGRVLTVDTDQPGIQIYTGNFLGGIHGKHGVVYNKHTAICLETQNWPNAINNPKFPDSVCKPEEPYKHTAWFTFSTTD